MKKIGICTITLTKNEDVDYNYGNILQNYAITIYLQNNGYDVKTIYYNTHYNPELIAMDYRKCSKNFLQIIDDALRVSKRRFNSKRILEKKSERRKKFDSFIKDYITYTKEEYNYSSKLCELNKEFDCFITGSDQVWNPYYEGSNAFFFLDFADPKKRIAYAPSIAVENIPPLISQSYSKWLNGVTYLSIREEAGKKLLKEKFGLDAMLVCDPVFLLNRNEWSKLLRAPQVQAKYFLVYILGKKTVDLKRKVRKLEKTFNMSSIDVYAKDDSSSEFAGPKEFVGLISNAEFVCTNSFHGAAFSIIFNKPIVVLDRVGGKAMNSRISNLLSIIGSKNRNVDYLIEHPEELMNMGSNKNNLNEMICDSKNYLLDSIEKAVL